MQNHQMYRGVPNSLFYLFILVREDNPGVRLTYAAALYHWIIQTTKTLKSPHSTMPDDDYDIDIITHLPF
jgi:hypothetical protein